MIVNFAYPPLAGAGGGQFLSPFGGGRGWYHSSDKREKSRFRQNKDNKNSKINLKISDL